MISYISTFTLNNLDIFQIVSLGIFEVSLIMCWYSHYSTSTIASKYEVTNIKWHFLAIYRIDCIYSLQWTARLSLVQICSIQIILLQCLIDISLNLIWILNSIHKALYNISIWSKYHECNAVNSFNTCCKY